IEVNDDFAHLADSSHAVRDEDHPRLLQALGENLPALLLEACIADRHHLVNQIVVEVKGHAEPERKPRTHARRISRYRLIEIVADLRKLLHEMHLLLNTGPANTLNPADELHVVASGQVLLQAAGETDGPGEPRVRRDLAPGLTLPRAD